jgi:hypothetical protein
MEEQTKACKDLKFKASFSPYSTKKISMAGNLYLGAVLSSLVKGH